MFDLRQRTYAVWSAENRLSNAQIQRIWPEIGQQQQSCNQGDYGLWCEEQVSATDNPDTRRMEIKVYPARNQQRSSDQLLTTLVAYLSKP
jgi:general secretion pathway protein I